MRETKKSFYWIINILKNKNIDYKITGGLAGIGYGSDRLLNDIDIEIDFNRIPDLINEVRDFIVFGPALYEDREWKIHLLTLRYLNQEIDISSNIFKIFNFNNSSWEIMKSNLEDFNIINLFDIDVRVETRDNLISYKSKLKRGVDLIDIEKIKDK